MRRGCDDEMNKTPEKCMRCNKKRVLCDAGFPKARWVCFTCLTEVDIKKCNYCKTKLGFWDFRKLYIDKEKFILGICKKCIKNKNSIKNLKELNVE